MISLKYQKKINVPRCDVCQIGKNPERNKHSKPKYGAQAELQNDLKLEKNPHTEIILSINTMSNLANYS